MKTKFEIHPTLLKRYSKKIALRHEALYGTGYQGPASHEVFSYFASLMHIEPKQDLLEIGCGLGGDSFRLSSEYQANVLGLDASRDMIDTCNSRKTELDPESINFKVADMRQLDFLDDNSFDIVWTRDSVAYINEKEKLDMWRVLYKKLRENGKILATDYCIGENVSCDFRKKMEKWSQSLITMTNYKEIIKKSMFQNVVVEDRTKDLREGTEIGLKLLLNNREEALESLTEQEYTMLLDRWQRKLYFMDEGSVKWMLLTASK